MDRFGPCILNAMAEIDLLDEEEELPDVTEVVFLLFYIFKMDSDLRLFACFFGSFILIESYKCM